MDVQKCQFSFELEVIDDHGQNSTQTFAIQYFDITLNVMSQLVSKSLYFISLQIGTNIYWISLY